MNAQLPIARENTHYSQPYCFAMLSCTPGFFWLTSSETLTKETLGSGVGAGEETPRAMAYYAHTGR